MTTSGKLRHTVVLMSLTALPAVCPAQAPFTPAQVLSNVRIGDLHYSPDGRRLSFTARSYRWDYKAHLCVLDLVPQSQRNLTPDGKSDRAAQWSPDGKNLGFLSNRSGRTQVYLMPAGGGEAVAVTSARAGVDSFHWSPDATQIAYLAKTDDAPVDNSGPQVTDQESNLSRLWIMGLASKSTRMVSKRGWRIAEFQWRTGTELLAIATDQPWTPTNTNALYRVSASDGAMQKLTAPEHAFDSLHVSPDARQYTLRSTHTDGPEPRDLLVGSIGSLALQNVSARVDRAIREVRWPQAQQLFASVADGFYNRIAQFIGPGDSRSVSLPLSVSSFDVAANGDIAFVGEDYEHRPEIYLRSRSGKIHQLSHIQQPWEGGPFPLTTRFKTSSFDATPIEAVLMKPAVSKEGRRSPLVLLVHGGPSSNFSAGFSWETCWAQLLASRGYAVLMVNPRGSNGYSEDFLKANRGDWGGGDYRDLMAVLDAVVAQGGIDPDRLGIGGWSYGGEMSAWAITQSQRFKAAVAGAPVYDQQAEFETEDNAEDMVWYFGKPWEHPEIYARNSPATYIGDAHTPTLILDGLDDEANPAGQSKGLYRALKYLGVDTQLVLYPGEGHSPVSRDNNIDMFERISHWYDHYLHTGK